jgi:hypothetical protein
MRFLYYQPTTTISASYHYTRRDGGNWEEFARLIRLTKKLLQGESHLEEGKTPQERIALRAAQRIESAALLSKEKSYECKRFKDKDYMLLNEIQSRQPFNLVQSINQTKKLIMVDDGKNRVKVGKKVKGQKDGVLYDFTAQAQGIPKTIPGEFLNLVLAEEMRREVISDDYSLKAKVVVLTDPSVARGLKTRVVTKSALPELIGSKGINTCLLKLLKRVPELRPILNGKTLDELERLPFKKDSKRELLGADLSRASDLIQHSVGQAVMQGIGEGLGWSPTTMKFIHKCNGSVSLEYDDEIVKSKRGELMGMPYAFATLCILNVWAARNAESMFEKRKEFPKFRRGTVMSNISGRRDESYPDFRVPYTTKHTGRCRGFGMGDDFVLYGTKEVNEGFMNLLNDAGLLINPSKQFLDPESTVFTEERYKLFESKGITKLRRLKTIRASTIVSAKLRRSDGSRSDAVQPDYIRIGAVFSNVEENSNGRHRRTALSLLRVFHHKVIKQIADAGIPLYWPRGLGGAGLRGRKWFAPQIFRKAAAVILTKDTAEVRKHTLELRWLWQNRMPSKLADVVSNATKKVILTGITGPSTDRIQSNFKSDVTTTEAEDIVRKQFLGFLVSEHDLVRQSKQRRRTSLKMLGGQLRKRIRELASCWKSAKPMTNEKVKDRLAHHRQAKLFNSQILTAAARVEIHQNMLQSQMTIEESLHRKLGVLEEIFSRLTLEQKQVSTVYDTALTNFKALEVERENALFIPTYLALGPTESKRKVDLIDKERKDLEQILDKSRRSKRQFQSDLNEITLRINSLGIQNQRRNIVSTTCKQSANGSNPS